MKHCDSAICLTRSIYYYWGDSRCLLSSKHFIYNDLLIPWSDFVYTNVYVCSMYICMVPSIIAYCVERVCMMPSTIVYCVERVCMMPSIAVYCVERVCMVPSIIVYCVERVCMMPSIISECFPTGCHWATPRIRIRDKEISCDDICISLYHSHHSMLYVGIHLPHLSMFDRPRCLAEPPNESLCSHIFAAGHIAYYNITLFSCHTTDSSP